MDTLDRLLTIISTNTNGVMDAVFLTFVLCAFVYMFYKATRRAEKSLDWTDLITDKGNNSVSITRLTQLIGLIISTWVIIVLTTSGKVTYDMYGMYLSFVVGGTGWTNYLKMKYGKSTDVHIETDSTSTIK
jgi:hypothetical protein